MRGVRCDRERHAEAPRFGRTGFTLTEIILVIAIISVLLALLIPAVQRVRAAMDRMRCAAQLSQIGLALHTYHNDYRVFPPGITLPKPDEKYAYMTFLNRLTPYLELNQLWSDSHQAWSVSPIPFRAEAHRANFARPVRIFGCPLDWRVRQPQRTHEIYVVGLTSYVGVAGIDYTTKDGMLYADSRTSLFSVPDGASYTLLMGERPPSTDFWFGWWYASAGQAESGTPDVLLGVRELNIPRPQTYFCPPGPYHFVPGKMTNQCDAFHFWSLHPGGGHFLMAGGSVHFFRYAGADEVLPALATRRGGEKIASLPE